MSNSATAADANPLHALGDFTTDRRLILLSAIAIVIGVIGAYVASRCSR